VRIGDPCRAAAGRGRRSRSFARKISTNFSRKKYIDTLFSCYYNLELRWR
jgi:hypothetical protein